ncbi:MAG: hypothetical protein AUJ03_01415 [Deltaproteobacteria bacterium 13_1_40CM_3_71_4]|nr:MAG: hypothetical protein AUJ03_01415 [Deltaproteobacteria bacterium 13_1_40CM_3_71_4]
MPQAVPTGSWCVILATNAPSAIPGVMERHLVGDEREPEPEVRRDDVDRGGAENHRDRGDARPPCRRCERRRLGLCPALRQHAVCGERRVHPAASHARATTRAMDGQTASRQRSHFPPAAARRKIDACSPPG